MIERIIELLRAALPEGELDWSPFTHFDREFLAVRYRRAGDQIWVEATYDLEHERLGTDEALGETVRESAGDLLQIADMLAGREPEEEIHED
jgi:hypothetical protein